VFYLTLGFVGAFYDFLDATSNLLTVFGVLLQCSNKKEVGFLLRSSRAATRRKFKQSTLLSRVHS